MPTINEDCDRSGSPPGRFLSGDPGARSWSTAAVHPYLRGERRGPRPQYRGLARRDRCRRTCQAPGDALRPVVL